MLTKSLNEIFFIAFHAFRNTPFVLAELGEDAGIYGSVRMLFDEVKLEEEEELEL